MSAKDQEQTIRSALELAKKLYEERTSEINRSKLAELIPFLPILGLPKETSAYLVPMIDCEDYHIRSSAFQALTELNQDAGLVVVISKIKDLIPKFPSIGALDAHLSDEEKNRINTDIISVIYGLKGLFLSKSIDNRKQGFDFLGQLRQKYSTSEKGREIYSQIIAALEKVGVPHDLIDGDISNAKQRASKAPPERAEKSLQNSIPVPSGIE